MGKRVTGKPERADAARNRAAILAAAADLFDAGEAQDVRAVSIADIAVAAGVGKGTVFRRFGDRTALIKAVLQPRARELRASVESGPPPLGPGGPPEDRLHAYLDALFDFMWANRGLIRALQHQGSAAFYTNPASTFWIAELTRRLRVARPGEDARYLAHAMFTALRADVVDHLTGSEKMAPDRLRRGLHRLAGPRQPS